MSADAQSRPPRVLQVIDSLRTGGAESLLTTLVRELSASGRARVWVYAATERGADPDLHAALERDAEGVYVQPGRPTLYDPRIARAILSLQRGFDPDVVHSHLVTANVSSRLTAFLTRTPHLTTVHTPPGGSTEETRKRVIAEGVTARLSTRLIAPSRETAEAYERAFKLRRGTVGVIANAPVAVLPPGFDRERLRAELLGAEGAKVVLCVSRLQLQKGVADLVEAAALLTQRRPDVRFLVAGNGPEQERLERQAADLGLDGRLRLLGRRGDVGALLACADAFCLPSWHEGTPISLLEALENGIPCVATAVGGVPDLVEDGSTGLLVPPRSPEQLALALERVLDDPALARRLGEGGRRVVERHHSRSAMAASYADVYDELVRGGGRRRAYA